MLVIRCRHAGHDKQELFTHRWRTMLLPAHHIQDNKPRLLSIIDATSIYERIFFALFRILRYIACAAIIGTFLLQTCQYPLQTNICKLGYKDHVRLPLQPVLQIWSSQAKYRYTGRIASSVVISTIRNRRLHERYETYVLQELMPTCIVS